MVLWLFHNRIALNYFYGSMWNMAEIPAIELRTNNWRPGFRCLSITLRIWRHDFNIVFWQMPTRKKHRRY